MTAGNVHDIVPATSLIECIRGNKILADKAYDANKLIESASAQHMEVVIPAHARRMKQRNYDWHTYKERHPVEYFFEKLKEFRRVATRYNKLSIAFKASVMIAACLIWLQ